MRASRIRFIALDLDGTVLDDRKQVPAANTEALKEAERRGIHLSIVSGRMVPRIEAVLPLLGVDCSIIAYNGAKIWGRRSEGRPVLYHQPLDPEVASFLMGVSRDRGFPLNFYYQDLMHAEPTPTRADLRDLYARRTGAEYQYVEDLTARFEGRSPTKIILLAYPDECALLLRELKEKLAGRAFVTRSEPEYLEIMAPGVDKGSGLLRLARYYGIAPEETMALGDAENDIEMLQAAAVGVAMANASEHVRASADYVTQRTNDEGGVAEAIRRYALAGC